MLERTDAITSEVLEPITFVPAYPTVYTYIFFLFGATAPSGPWPPHSRGF
jgi:hypothetical protein